MLIKTAKNTLSVFLNKPFPFLDNTKDKLFLVIFCGIFSTLFINIYKPLNITTWVHDSAIGNFLTIWSGGIIGALVLGFTQFVIRPRINLNTLNVGQFSLWVLFEFLFLTTILFLIYKDNANPFWVEFFTVLRITFYLAILPYFLACLLIAVKQLSKKAEQKVESSSISLAQYSLKDENDKIVLVIKPQQLLLLKSENNYTSVFFLQNEQVEKKLIRTNLKKLENELKEFPNLLRIHRSYMINLTHIDSVDRKKGSFQLLLTQLPDMPLKVSETYKPIFETHIRN